MSKRSSANDFHGITIVLPRPDVAKPTPECKLIPGHQEPKERAQVGYMGAQDQGDASTTGTYELVAKVQFSSDGKLEVYVPPASINTTSAMGNLAGTTIITNSSAGAEWFQANICASTSYTNSLEFGLGSRSMPLWAGDQGNYRIVFEDTEETKAANFLDGLYGLTAAGKEDDAIDEVIDCFDDLLARKEFGLCETILRLADINRIAPSVSLAILSMTVIEKNALVKRPAFISRLRLNLINSRGPKEAAELLAGLQ